MAIHYAPEHDFPKNKHGRTIYSSAVMTAFDSYNADPELELQEIAWKMGVQFDDVRAMNRSEFTADNPLYAADA